MKISIRRLDATPCDGEEREAARREREQEGEE
jgi:hypothetical protein